MLLSCYSGYWCKQALTREPEWSFLIITKGARGRLRWRRFIFWRGTHFTGSFLFGIIIVVVPYIVIDLGIRSFRFDLQLL